MDFARRELMKHGWTEGEGLGKKSNGISKPIRIPLKRDHTGVGFDPGAEFTNHWWKTAFHSALEGIHVDQNSHSCHDDDDDSDDSDGHSGEAPAINKSTERITLSKEDQLLLQACGGRTAHKAARHGLKMGGKLKRLAEQEKLVAQQERQATQQQKRAAQQQNEAAQEQNEAAKRAAQEQNEAAKRAAQEQNEAAKRAAQEQNEAAKRAAQQQKRATQQQKRTAQQERKASQQKKQGA